MSDTVCDASGRSGSIPTPGVPGTPVPRLTTGLELHGEYQGSGFTSPQYIARRGDGQVLQMSQLLYLVASEIDGRRGLDEIARRVTASYGRNVSPGNIEYLLSSQLQPLGVVASGATAEVGHDAPRSDLLLALSGRRVLIPQRAVIPVARALAWLHLPVVVVAALAGLVAFDVWLFGYAGAIDSLIGVLTEPALLLVVAGLTLASLLFHEFGHASGCYYSGAKPGNIGCGLYLVWPALYTDVTDCYRVSRAGRLRTDFGGIYFNIIFILGMAGAYAATGHGVFLVTAFFVHFEILEQLLPVVRLDGYFILGDLAGVPDMFGKVRPILLSVIRRRTTDPRVTELKRSTRIVVTVWTMIVFPLLAVNIAYAVWNLPRILTATLASAGEQADALVADWGAGHYASVALGSLSLIFLILPSVGLTYLLIRMVVQAVRQIRRFTVGRPAARAVLAAAGGLFAAALVTVWLVLGL